MQMRIHFMEFFNALSIYVYIFEAAFHFTLVQNKRQNESGGKERLFIGKSHAVIG